LLTIVINLGLSIFIVGQTEMVEIFTVSAVTVVLCLTLSVASFGLGTVFWSAISDSPRVGSVLCMFPVIIFVLLQFPIALPTSYGEPLALRFVTALFGAPVLRVVAGVLADVYHLTTRAYAMSV